MFLPKAAGVFGVVTSALFVSGASGIGRPNPPLTLERAGISYPKDALGGIGNNPRHLMAHTPGNRDWWTETYEGRFLHRAKAQMTPSSLFINVRGPNSLGEACTSAYLMKPSSLRAYNGRIRSDIETFCTSSGVNGTISFLGNS